MNTIHHIIAIVALGLPASAEVITVLNDWDATQTVPLTAIGGATTEVGEFWSLARNNQIKITSATTPNFTQFATTTSFPRNSAFLTALASGTSLNLDYRSFPADNTLADSPSFRFRLLVNTDAGGLGYAGATSPNVTIDAAATVSANGTLVWTYSENSAFLSALDAYCNETGNAGSFFELIIDNTGFPGLPGPAVFSLDNLRIVSSDVVIPEVTVFNNFDAIQTVPFSANGGASATVGEFWTLPGNSQFKITSPITENFTGLAKTDGLSRESAFLAALATGTSLNLDYRSFAADNSLDSSPSFNFRLLVNTDAGGLGYAGATSTNITIDAAASTDVSGTLVWTYSTNPSFMAALNDYRNNTGNAGSYFEFMIDNTGFPGLPSPAVFSIDNFRVVSASADPFAQWLAANAPATGFITDSDGDGLPNGVENVLGSNPNTASAGLTGISATPSSASFSHSLNATIASNVSYSYQWSTDLTEWKATGQTNIAGTTATIAAAGSGPVTVTTTIISGPAGKLFTRLVANKVP